METSAARSGDRLAKEMGPLKDPRDRGLATELVYGVLRWQRQLDHVLKPRIKQGLSRLEPIARALLRIGAYQILHLDRIPAPIAVSATQDAARSIGAGRLTGLINGVLRRVAEHGFTPPEGASNAAIAVRTSLPTWLVATLRTQYGDHDLEREAMALRTRASNTVRVTRSKGGIEALTSALQGTPFSIETGASGTAIVTGPGDPFDSDAFHQGLFVPQDPASLEVIELLDITPGMRVLDLCAGRGIKATAIADAGAEVLATDLDEGKLRACNALAERLGVSSRITTRAIDGTAPELDLGTFDRVLVDAPCTGLGTLRRHPEIAWRRRPDDIERMASLQRQLLANAARHVSAKGLLVYAVCTFTQAEGPPESIPGFTRIRETSTRPSDLKDAFQATAWRRDQTID